MPRLLTFLKYVMVPALVAAAIWLSGIREIYDAILRSSFVNITEAFVLSLLSVGLTAVKWRLIIPAIKTLELLKAALIGQFYSFFLFGQASGEAAKIYLISRETGSISSATVSVFTDRLTSFIGMLVISVVGFALSSGQYPAQLQQVALIGLVLLIGILAALRHDAFFIKTEHLAAWVESRSPAYSSVIARELRKAIQQWHIAISRLSRVLAGISIGALAHIVNVITFIVLARSIAVHLDLFDWCWIAGLISVAGLIPITIGQMAAGGALVALLHLQGIPVTDALALSALTLLVNAMLAMTGGALEWRRLRAQTVRKTSVTDRTPNLS